MPTLQFKGINANKPHLWKADIAASVDQFNQWFMQFAPQAFRATRVKTTENVKAALLAARDLRSIDCATLLANPGSLLLEENLTKVCRVLTKLLDRDIFPWLDAEEGPADHERDRASTIVADRLCSAVANEIVRRARKKHQFAVVDEYLKSRGYLRCRHPADQQFTTTLPGRYEFDVTLPLTMGSYDRASFDVLVQPKHARFDGLPILLDLKSAPTAAAARNRRDVYKKKIRYLRMTYSESIPYALMLGGTFDTGYLGTQAAEGLDWIWEHRLSDLDTIVG